MKLVNEPKDFCSFKLLIRWLDDGESWCTPKNSSPGFWTSQAIASAASRVWNRYATCRRDVSWVVSNGRNTLQVSRCFHFFVSFIQRRHHFWKSLFQSWILECGIKMAKFKLNVDLPSWFFDALRIDRFTHCGELVQSPATSVIPKKSQPWNWDLQDFPSPAQFWTSLYRYWWDWFFGCMMQ